MSRVRPILIAAALVFGCLALLVLTSPFRNAILCVLVGKREVQIAVRGDCQSLIILWDGTPVSGPNPQLFYLYENLGNHRIEVIMGNERISRTYIVRRDDNYVRIECHPLTLLP
ncbi:MAG: hypothetical protein DCC46_10480 [Armatimonadetes bacterium]|nr:MAG: hypothetical protein DCC46_10480 [Armatimonadota bacterium]